MLRVSLTTSIHILFIMLFGSPTHSQSIDKIQIDKIKSSLLFDDNGRIYARQSFEFDTIFDLDKHSKQWICGSYGFTMTPIHYENESSNVILAKVSMPYLVGFAAIKPEWNVEFDLKIEIGYKLARMYMKDFRIRNSSDQHFSIPAENMVEEWENCFPEVQLQHMEAIVKAPITVFELFEREIPIR